MERKCCYCERVLGGDLLLTREHVHPLSKGGEKSDTTLICCKPCNNWRGNRTLSDWGSEIIRNKYREGYSACELNVILENIQRIKREFIAE